MDAPPGAVLAPMPPSVPPSVPEPLAAGEPTVAANEASPLQPACSSDAAPPSSSGAPPPASPTPMDLGTATPPGSAGDDGKQPASASKETTDYLRALSLKQPFCSALVLGLRKQESRTWKIKLPHDGSGLWVAAHSPAKASPASDPGMAQLRQMWPDMPSLDQLPRSSIVGFLHVQEVVPIEEFAVERREPGCTGPFVWVIDRTIPLEAPFHCAGALGMWAPPKDLPVPQHGQSGRLGGATAGHHGLIRLRLKA